MNAIGTNVRQRETHTVEGEGRKNGRTEEGRK